MRVPVCFLLLICLLALSCGSPEQGKQRSWTEQELKSLQGKTRDEVREILGSPNGFYTRSAEGRWHYSNMLLDQGGAGEPKRVWLVIYFSQFGEQRATIVEIHEHKIED